MVLFYGHDWNVLRTTLSQTEQLCTKLQVNTNAPLRQQLLSVMRLVPPNIWLTEAEISNRQFKADILYRWGQYERYSIRYPQALHYLHRVEYSYASLHQTQDEMKARLSLAGVYL